MKVATIAVAAAMALSMVPAAGAESVYDQNVTWLVNNYEAAGFNVDDALLNDILTVSNAAADRGLVLSAIYEMTPTVPGGPHAGEIWAQCFAFFFGSCAPANDVAPTGLPCQSVPAHWAAFVWTPASTVVEYTNVDLYTWTESHAGIDGLFTPGQSGTMAGSGCLLSNSSSLVAGYHDGVFA